MTLVQVCSSCIEKEVHSRKKSMHVHMPFHLTASVMSKCPQRSRSTTHGNTLVIWSPLGLLDFKVEFEEGVANLFGTSYLWPHCEELDELHGFHSYGICEVMEYTHRFVRVLYSYAFTKMMQTAFVSDTVASNFPTKERIFPLLTPTTPAETWCCKVPCSC